MNKEAPIGADSFCDNERYCQIKIGTNWCLLIHSVFLRALSYQEGIKRDTVILRSAPIGADLDIRICNYRFCESNRHQLVPILI